MASSYWSIIRPSQGNYSIFFIRNCFQFNVFYILVVFFKSRAIKPSQDIKTSQRTNAQNIIDSHHPIGALYDLFKEIIHSFFIRNYFQFNVFYILVVFFKNLEPLSQAKILNKPKNQRTKHYKLASSYWSIIQPIQGNYSFVFYKKLFLV